METHVVTHVSAWHGTRVAAVLGDHSTTYTEMVPCTAGCFSSLGLKNVLVLQAPFMLSCTCVSHCLQALLKAGYPAAADKTAGLFTKDPEGAPTLNDMQVSS